MRMTDLVEVSRIDSDQGALGIVSDKRSRLVANNNQRKGIAEVPGKTRHGSKKHMI